MRAPVSWALLGGCAWLWVAGCSMTGEIPAEAAVPGGLTAVGILKVLFDQRALDQRLTALGEQMRTLTGRIDDLFREKTHAAFSVPVPHPVHVRIRARRRIGAAAAGPRHAHRRTEPHGE